MPDTIQILVNGEARAWRRGATVADLLQDLEITIERVAVELNLEILDRASFPRRPLEEGDRVEILSFIGGGSEERTKWRFGHGVIRRTGR
jgi:thiamine biosynthesis protein ThiS